MTGHRSSARPPAVPSAPFCPPLSRVRRQCAWRPWRTGGQKEQILSAYDRPCPHLAAGARQNKQRSWRTRALFVRRWPARGSCPTAARPAPWCSTVGYSCELRERHGPPQTLSAEACFRASPPLPQSLPGIRGLRGERSWSSSWSARVSAGTAVFAFSPRRPSKVAAQ